MNIYKVKEENFSELIKIWESAVLSTHQFLAREDFLYYKSILISYFNNLDLFSFKEDGKIVAFLGVANSKIEMLFVHNDKRGKGIGSKLLLYAINYLKINKVDVNE